MINTLKNYFRKALIGPVKNFSYAQAGDDIILRFLFHKKIDAGEKGFYVDIGSYHPYHDSNTYLFYKSGWRGINIDATPGSMNPFKQARPDDINLEIGITGKEGVMDYYWIGEDSTMNSFSSENLEKNGMRSSVKKIIPVTVKPLRSVLAEYKQRFTEIDLLNIDVEGMDYEVLNSNDWNTFRPLVISLELSTETIDDLLTNPSAQFLKSKGYNIVAKNIITKEVATVFFVRNDFQY